MESLPSRYHLKTYHEKAAELLLLNEAANNSSSGNKKFVSDQPTNLDLKPCPICTRTFVPDTLTKHVAICEKMAMKKRKKFDSSKQRREGTDLADFLPKGFGLPTSSPSTATGATGSSSVSAAQISSGICKKNKLVTSVSPKFQQTSASFDNISKESVSTTATLQRKSSNHNNVAQNNASSVFKPKVEKKRSFMPAPLPCPVCERCFGYKAYDRHVEYCRERSKLLENQKHLTKSAAKERLEARIKYRAPCLKSKRAANREKYSGYEGINGSRPDDLLSIADSYRTCPEEQRNRFGSMATSLNSSIMSESISLVKENHNKKQFYPKIPNSPYSKFQLNKAYENNLNNFSDITDNNDEELEKIDSSSYKIDDTSSDKSDFENEIKLNLPYINDGNILSQNSRNSTPRSLIDSSNKNISKKLMKDKIDSSIIESNSENILPSALKEKLNSIFKCKTPLITKKKTSISRPSSKRSRPSTQGDNNNDNNNNNSDKNNGINSKTKNSNKMPSCNRPSLIPTKKIVRPNSRNTLKIHKDFNINSTQCNAPLKSTQNQNKINRPKTSGYIREKTFDIDKDEDEIKENSNNESNIVDTSITSSNKIADVLKTYENENSYREENILKNLNIPIPSSILDETIMRNENYFCQDSISTWSLCRDDSVLTFTVEKPEEISNDDNSTNKFFSDEKIVLPAMPPLDLKPINDLEDTNKSDIYEFCIYSPVKNCNNNNSVESMKILVKSPFTSSRIRTSSSRKGNKNSIIDKEDVFNEDEFDLTEKFINNDENNERKNEIFISIETNQHNGDGDHDDETFLNSFPLIKSSLSSKSNPTMESQLQSNSDNLLHEIEKINNFDNGNHESNLLLMNEINDEQQQEQQKQQNESDESKQNVDDEEIVDPIREPNELFKKGPSLFNNDSAYGSLSRQYSPIETISSLSAKRRPTSTATSTTLKVRRQIPFKNDDNDENDFLLDLSLSKQPKNPALIAAPTSAAATTTTLLWSENKKRNRNLSASSSSCSNSSSLDQFSSFTNMTKQNYHHDDNFNGDNNNNDDSITPSSLSLTKSSSSTSNKMSKFCHECGSKFVLSQAKFCMECGVKRIILE